MTENCESMTNTTSNTFEMDVNSTDQTEFTTLTNPVFDVTDAGNDSFTTGPTAPTTDVFSFYYEEYIYPGYPFERIIYVYLWEVMVVLVTLVNIVVISVFTRSGLRSTTNVILVFISIADSLTGLVTMPSYILVYGYYEEEKLVEYADNATYQYSHSWTYEDSEYYYSDKRPLDGYDYESHPYTVYVLTKELCTYFMLSKFFFAKLFHTISIYLTLFLGFQRCVCVMYPLRTQSMFSLRRTLIVCCVIFLLSPLLHLYHILEQKATQGMCNWELESTEEGFIFLWVILFVRHLIPCLLLTIFTILIIREMRRNSLSWTDQQITKRVQENRRVSITVTCIVIVFLIPEIPYSGFLLSSVIRKHLDLPFDLMTNRAIHAVYEISIIVSFHANFYIYACLNKHFRLRLKEMFIHPVARMFESRRH